MKKDISDEQKRKQKVPLDVTVQPDDEEAREEELGKFFGRV